MYLENLTLEQTRTAIQEEWHCQLGDGMKAMLLRLVDRVEVAETKLAAMESQEPVFLMRNRGDTYWAEVNKETYEDYIAAEGKDELPCDTLTLYRSQMPAEAVPDSELLAEKQEVEALCGKAPFYPVDAEKLRNLCVRLIDENMLLRQSAPSHSQQSANRITEQDVRNLLVSFTFFRLEGHAMSPLEIVEKYISDEKGKEILSLLNADRSQNQQSAQLIDDFAMRLAEKFQCGMSGGDVFAEAKAFKLDRCPSHESEQGYNPKTFGAIPDQQTEGE